jgi:hypothetical protein
MISRYRFERNVYSPTSTISSWASSTFLNSSSFLNQGHRCEFLEIGCHTIFDWVDICTIMMRMKIVSETEFFDGQVFLRRSRRLNDTAIMISRYRFERNVYSPTSTISSWSSSSFFNQGHRCEFLEIGCHTNFVWIDICTIMKRIKIVSETEVFDGQVLLRRSRCLNENAVTVSVIDEMPKKRYRENIITVSFCKKKGLTPQCRHLHLLVFPYHELVQGRLLDRVEPSVFCLWFVNYY